jgi:hypothetical protein
MVTQRGESRQKGPQDSTTTLGGERLKLGLHVLCYMFSHYYDASAPDLRPKSFAFSKLPRAQAFNG